MLGEEDRKLYELSEKFQYSKTLLVAVKGFKKKDLNKLNKIKNELALNPNLTIKDYINNKSLQEFKNKYRFYINDINDKNSSKIDVKTKLTNIYNEMISSTFYFNINKNDPLGLLKSNTSMKGVKLKDGNLILGEYGYLSILSIESKNNEKSRIKIYNDIHNISSKYENTKVFSTMFFYVENSQKIKQDVRIIIITSMVLLSILYLIILRNIYLFINVALTLVTSVIFGQIFITYIFDNTSIIALVFATAVTSVSIDYMFHHYLHNYYDGKFGFNRSVFYGYITTISAFILMSNIQFPLIQQISIFTIISLSVAYIHFAFIYQYLGIKHIKVAQTKHSIFSLKIQGYKIILFSLILIILSLFYVKYDFNIKNLDYQNIKLIQTEKFFRTNLNQKGNRSILITGETINSVIKNAKIIKKIDQNARVAIASLLDEDEYLKRLKIIQDFDFKALKTNIEQYSSQIGFKNNYFKNSYNDNLIYPNSPKYTQKMINDFGFDLIKDGDKYITYAIVSSKKMDELLDLKFVKNVSAKMLFENSLSKINNQLVLFGTLAILLIIFILAIITQKRFFQAFSYILFPISLMICYGYFVPLNIMNIFMLFVVIAISIDYGIYMNESNITHNTFLAIIYSLISTFAGFGVLVLSDINSLLSIGITTIIGICGILFLLVFQKSIKAT